MGVKLLEVSNAKAINSWKSSCNHPRPQALGRMRTGECYLIDISYMNLFDPTGLPYFKFKHILLSPYYTMRFLYFVLANKANSNEIYIQRK